MFRIYRMQFFILSEFSSFFKLLFLYLSFSSPSFFVVVLLLQYCSSGKLTEIPIQKPAATKDKSTNAMESKENEPEPSRIVRLRRNRGVVISQNETDGQMLTEMFVQRSNNEDQGLNDKITRCFQMTLFHPRNIVFKEV